MPLVLENVNYIYNPGTAYEKQAVKDISLEIPDGQFMGIIGHTGSGKSTLIQHLNGLVRPTSGRVLFNGEDIWADKYDRHKLRFHVGIVFQYPDHQLFETTVVRDVSYGPKNQGLSEKEAEEKAKEALIKVGVAEELFEKSPFELSGGQKRRVAIAGALAMDPDVLILDEPTAGLDPQGRDEILDMVNNLQDTTGLSVVLVSHSMEDVAKYVDRLVVMNKGEIIYDGVPREIFANYKELEKIGLSAPQVTYLMHDLKAAGFDVDETAITIEEAEQSILKGDGSFVLKSNTKGTDH